MGIQRLVAKTVVENHRIAIALFPTREFHFRISRSKHLGACRSGKVHTLVELTHMIHRVDTHAITRCHALEVLVHHGLNGRDILHANLLILSHFHHLFIGFGLHIQFLLQDIHLERQVSRQLVVGHASELLIVRDLALCALANAQRNRFSAKQHAIEVVIALLQVGHHHLHLVHLAVEGLQLRLQSRLLALQLLLARRWEEYQEEV